MGLDRLLRRPFVDLLVSSPSLFVPFIRFSCLYRIFVFSVFPYWWMVLRNRLFLPPRGRRILGCMKQLMLLLFLLVCLPVSAVMAQPALPARSPVGIGKEGEVLSKPICSWLNNRSKQTILGTMTTAPQTLPDGSSARHRNNFRLSAGERRQFCAAGPFFEGQRVEITLRTLLPLFTCKTKIDREIFLDAKPGDGGFTKLTATCH